MADCWRSVLIIVITQSIVMAETFGTCPGLDYKLSLCVRPDRTQVQTLDLLLQCVRASIFRCLEFHQPQPMEHMESHFICGVINSGFSNEPMHWDIKVCFPFRLLINTLHFHIFHSVRCQKASVKLIADGEDKKHYCGKLAPFSVSFVSTKAKVTYDEISDFYYGYHFVLYYEGVNRTQTVPEIYPTPNAGFINNTYVYPGLYQRNMNQLIVFVAKAINRLSIEILTHVTVHIHDGPGPLSSVLDVHFNQSGFASFVFTASLGCIAATVPVISAGSQKDSGFRNEYLTIKYSESKVDHFHQNPSQCQLFDTGDRLVLTGHSTAKTTSCFWMLDARRELIVNEFEYNGWDTLVYAAWDTESPANTMLKTHCQYGGLHTQPQYTYDNTDNVQQQINS